MPQEPINEFPDADWVELSRDTTELALAEDPEVSVDIAQITKVGIGNWIRELLAETTELISDPTKITRLGVKHKIIFALYNVVKSSVAGAIAGMAAHELGSDKEIEAAITGACFCASISATFWILVANIGIFPAIRKVLPSILSHRRSDD